MGAPELQRPIRNAKAARSPLQTAVFDGGRVLNSDVLGSAADFLEPGAEDDRALDGCLNWESNQISWFDSQVGRSSDGT